MPLPTALCQRRCLKFERFEPRYRLSGISFATRDISCCSVGTVSSLAVADVDGDGDVDAISAGMDRVVWYENTDGYGGFGEPRGILPENNGVSFVTAADLDGDGDIDLLTASFRDDTVAWYENLEGLGSIGSQRIITTVADGVKSVTNA